MDKKIIKAVLKSQVLNQMGNHKKLEKLGFKFSRNGAHSARTMMLAELRALFATTTTETTKNEYQNDIVEFNLLDKQTVKTRNLTFKHLVNLYGLSNEIPLFRVFRKLWGIDSDAQPLLTMQYALVRDSILQLSIPTVLAAEPGDIITRTEVEAVLKAPDPERFSPASLKSIAQNINASWTQAGFLSGRIKKIRTHPKVTPVNVVFALFLSYLEGATGERLLNSIWTQYLQLNNHELIELATAASHRGIIDFKQSGGVTEVRFHGFLTAEEEQWRHE
jgi:hypothetical protein